MNYSNFEEWLQKSKSFAKRSARDVTSRIRRVKRILDTDEITIGTLDDLESSLEFQSCSICVKSELRRAVKLLIEYQS